MKYTAAIMHISLTHMKTIMRYALRHGYDFTTRRTPIMKSDLLALGSIERNDTCNVRKLEIIVNMRLLVDQLFGGNSYTKITFLCEIFKSPCKDLIWIKSLFMISTSSMPTTVGWDNWL